MNDNWLWQGRQEHGWFGHGTAPDVDDVAEGGADATAAGAAPASAVASAARAAVGALPAASRAAFEATLSAATLAQMEAVFRSWERGNRRAPEAFARRYLDGAVIAAGTAIATFDATGRYASLADGSSHAAIYLGQTPQGIMVIDQWNEHGSDGSVAARRPAERLIKFANPGASPADQGGAFHVIR